MKLAIGLFLCGMSVVTGYSVTVLTAPAGVLFVIAGLAVSLAMIGWWFIAGWQREEGERWW